MEKWSQQEITSNWLVPRLLVAVAVAIAIDPTFSSLFSLVRDRYVNVGSSEI